VRSTDSARPLAWQIAAVVACLIGMASKEVMVSAPLLVLLLDRSLIAKTFTAAWARRRLLYLGLAATWLLLGAILFTIGGTRGTAAGFGLGVPWWAYALKQCEAIVLYLKLSLWPHPLVVDYGADVVRDFMTVLPQALVLMALLGTAAWAVVRRPAAGFLGAFFFAILAPSSSIVPLITQTVAEHRMYLPLAAVITLGVGASYVALRERGVWLLLGLAVAFGFATHRRNETFHDEISLWSDTLANQPQSIRVRVNLGNAFSDLGRSNEALAYYRAALQLAPDQADAWNGIGAQLIALGRAREAIEPCELALKYRPIFAEAHTNLGSALCATGRFDEAAKHFEAALALKPLLAAAHADLAGVLVGQKHYAEAIAHCESALHENPRIPDAWFNLAKAQAYLGRLADAAANYARTLQLNPNYPGAESDWGAVLAQENKFAEALPHFERAVTLDPKSVEARSNLGSVCFHLGRIDEAIAHFREAIRLNPELAESHANLALAFTRAGRSAEAIAECETTLRLQPDHAGARDNLAYLRGLKKN
jgi:tetratricopeptide (TPR) repeat protein